MSLLHPEGPSPRAPGLRRVGVLRWGAGVTSASTPGPVPFVCAFQWPGRHGKILSSDLSALSWDPRGHLM